METNKYYNPHTYHHEPSSLFQSPLLHVYVTSVLNAKIMATHPLSLAWQFGNFSITRLSWINWNNQAPEREIIRYCVKNIFAHISRGFFLFVFAGGMSTRLALETEFQRCLYYKIHGEI